MIVFHPADHSYKSISPDEDIQWISVSQLVGQFKQPFDALLTAHKVVKNKKSKWYGLEPNEVLAIWDKERTRSEVLGTWYHKREEDTMLLCETQEIYGKSVRVIPSLEDADGKKIAPDQKLEEGIYPEHMVYLKSVGVCGQSDVIQVVDNQVFVEDYKSNKEIKMEGQRNWEGLTARMLPPLAHLDDCNYYHYSLQLSTYMYIVLKHNPALTPGNILLKHVTFELEGEDKFGYPITKLDEKGEPIVKEVTPITVKYMAKEVEMMFNWLKNNRNNLKKK